MTTQELIAQWGQGGGRYLNEVESKQLLQAAGIRVADTIALTDPAEIVRASKALGYPLQLSAVVDERLPQAVAHEASVMIASEAEAVHACSEVVDNVKRWNSAVKFLGYTLREAPRTSVELRILVQQDPVLGPVMAVGFGRMAMEVWEDVAYRVVPLSKRDPHIMLNELKGAQKLFGGYRHLDRTNIQYVEELIIRVSDFVNRTPEVYELELDPVYANRRRVAVFDARIQLRTPVKA